MNYIQFIEHLRTALMQLDDLQALRQSPLLRLFSHTHTASNPVYLQKLLFEGIELVKEIDSPRSDRLYEILYYRYVEQCTQSDVAYQMDVSVRQLRREQNSALELLAELLWNRYLSSEEAQDPHAHTGHQPADDALQGEISWLNEFQAEASDLLAEFKRAIENASRIAEHYGVKLDTNLPPQLSSVAMPPMALRQALLTTLTAMISTCSDNVVKISIDQPAHTNLRVTFYQQRGPSSAKAVALQDFSMLRTISHLLAPFDARIDIEQADSLSITMTLPTIESIPVLVVEDNPDVRQLLQRYVVNTRFRVITTDESNRAIPLVSEFGVQAITLDIMMPGDDGWDLLARLRHHPVTKDIPIAVCTILPQRELSLLLGATAFIQKPVEQAAFLKLLGQMVSSG